MHADANAYLLMSIHDLSSHEAHDDHIYRCASRNANAHPYVIERQYLALVSPPTTQRDVPKLFLFLLLVSCSGPEELDLTNIENGVINFYDDIDETDNAPDANTFPTMKISTNFQDIVDEPKINAELLVIENNTEKNYKIGN